MTAQHGHGDEHNGVKRVMLAEIASGYARFGERHIHKSWSIPDPTGLW